MTVKAQTGPGPWREIGLWQLLISRLFLVRCVSASSFALRWFVLLPIFFIGGLDVSEREEYKDKSRQNCEHEGNKVMIGDCAQVSDQGVWSSCEYILH